MSALPPYNRAAKCPKCHSEDIAAKHKGFVSRSWKWSVEWRGGSDPIPDYVTDTPEHIMRTCRWCGYWWQEEPLDTVREIDVRSEAE